MKYASIHITKDDVTTLITLRVINKLLLCVKNDTLTLRVMRIITSKPQ